MHCLAALRQLAVELPLTLPHCLGAVGWNSWYSCGTLPHLLGGSGQRNFCYALLRCRGQVGIGTAAVTLPA